MPADERLGGRLREAVEAPVDTEADLEKVVRSGRRRRRARKAAVATAGSASVAIVLAVMLVVLTPVEVGRLIGSGESEDLWNRTFYSVSVTEAGEPHPLLSGTRIGMSFRAFRSDPGMEGSERRQALTWVAGCNQISGQVEVEEDRLRTYPPYNSTLVQCPGDREEQDAWVGGFLRSGPVWELEGRQLTLTSGDVVIELVEESLGLSVEEFEERWAQSMRDMGLDELTGAPELDVGRSQAIERDTTEEFPLFAEGQRDVPGGLASVSVSVNVDRSVGRVAIEWEGAPAWERGSDPSQLRRGAMAGLLRTTLPNLTPEDVEGIFADLEIDEEGVPHRSEAETTRDGIRFQVIRTDDGSGYAVSFVATPVL